jgi:hypothetical protein
LTFSGSTLSVTNIQLPHTTSTTTGVIYKNTVKIFHDYADATATGMNLFIGDSAGNFTLSPAGGSSTLASFNLGIGYLSLCRLTTGWKNTAIGGWSAWNLTTGVFNTAIGLEALGSATTCQGCTAIGHAAMSVGIVTGNYNTAIGPYAAQALTSGPYNVCISYRAGYSLTTGESNVFIGYYAGDANVTGIGNTCIGHNTGRVMASDSSGCVYIGYFAGRYETGTSKLFIDGMNRTTEAAARTDALIYGVFAADAANQDFIINGQVGVHITPTAWVTLPAGAAGAGLAPLKLTSGTSLTNAVAGTVEFTTDDLYFTITTGPARKGIILNDGANLTDGKIPIASTNGRLIDGQTPLAGTKIYYVADSSGGSPTRKLTFMDGILTSET